MPRAVHLGRAIARVYGRTMSHDLVAALYSQSGARFPAVLFDKRVFSTVVLRPPSSERKAPPMVPKDDTIEKMVAALKPGQKKCLQVLETGAMSHGSISYEAHTTIAEAVNRIAMAVHGVSTMKDLLALGVAGRPFSNSGEGGELESRDGTLYQSRQRQLASGRFGVDGRYVSKAVILQIKVNQGGKMGLGGQLEGMKVTVEIASARHTTPGVSLISPASLHDVYSIEDLKQWIQDLRAANPEAYISLKLGATDGLGVIAAGIVKCGADNISIAGPGGTGAAPITAKYGFPHPWELAVAEVHQALVREGLRESVTISVSGGFQTGLDYFKALLLGANYIEAGSSVLIAMGCVMAEVCHNGTCPTGIATQNKTLIADKFKGKPADVARFLIETAKALNEYLEKYALTDPAQAVGRTDLLRVKDNSPLIGLEKMLKKPHNAYAAFGRLQRTTNTGYLEKSVISQILGGCYQFELPASNTLSSFGARLAWHVVKTPGFKELLQAHPVSISFNGLSVGQSFGFLTPPHVMLKAENSNDGTGKSLDGGALYIKQVGNAACFGAIRGSLFAFSLGDRAAVRNSGADIMALTVGQMAANFMTGGRMTLLGSPEYYEGDLGSSPSPVLFRQDIIGPNMGAGFSGGELLLPKKLYQQLSERSGYLEKGMQLIAPQPLDEEDARQLTTRLQRFVQHLSPPSWIERLLSDQAAHRHFVKLDPRVRNVPAVSLLSTKVIESRKEPAVNDTRRISVIPMTIATNAPITALRKPQLPHVETEKEACGTGLLVRLDGVADREMTEKALIMLERFMHRGATGIDPHTGDGCGMTWFGLDAFFQSQFPDLVLEKGGYCILPMSVSESYKISMRLVLESLLSEEDLGISGEREVKTDRSRLGLIGQKQESTVFQFLVQKPSKMTRDDFEKALLRTRLRFEIDRQNEEGTKERAHLFSASSYHVIYKSLVKEDQFGKYFIDFHHPLFKVVAAICHARFATNVLPTIINIQPLGKFANNGENNALQLIVRSLAIDPGFAKLLGREKVVLSHLSDSHIMSLYMDYLQLLGFSLPQIVASTIHPLDLDNPISSDFYNVFAIPFEGPNASIVYMNNQVVVVRDKNGFRPQRGVRNDTHFYCGSELGTVDMSGDIVEFTPGKPLVIQLDTGAVSLSQASEDIRAFHRKQWEALQVCDVTGISIDPIVFPEEELRLRKHRVGWNREFHKIIMQPLFNTQKGSALTSMGDQGPIEVLARGTIDWKNLLKGKVAQVTNPPLASKEEAAYMSTQTYVGRRPALGQLNKEQTSGFLLSSPIVDNREMLYLQLNSPSATLDTTYEVQTRERGLQAAMDAVVERALSLVEEGVSLLVLSDVNVTNERAAMPGVLIASVVEHALLSKGLRRKVTLALQSADVLAGRDIAQVISIGGVDIVNPYLGFVPENGVSTHGVNYKESLRQELLGYMARLGISTVSAYRGTKGFNGYGLNPSLTALLGISSDLGGFGFRDLSSQLLAQHTMPSEEGTGKYSYNGELPRRKIWDTGVTQSAIKVARGTGSYAQFMSRAALLELGFPRGQLRLIEPRIWGTANPMTVCILGGGAAGFSQAESLLQSGLPVHVIIIERNAGNRFGLVGDGIAPDHVATKRQGVLLRQCLQDPRVQYFGGIEVGNDKAVTYQMLKALYPCIIDCRGAGETSILGIPGENMPGVVTASEVYTAYNAMFNPFETNGNWPFSKNSRDPNVVIIGNGNVAADIARMLLISPDKLVSTQVNPAFLQELRIDAPDVVHIIARGAPHLSKIGLKELLELRKLGVFMSATFDVGTVDKEALTENQQALLQFFTDMQDKVPPPYAAKRLLFHFQLTPHQFVKSGSEIAAVFIDLAGKTRYFYARNVVTAIGQRVKEDEDRPFYQSGWVAGKGGTLQVAQMSAKETTLEIEDAFFQGAFHHLTPPAVPQPWQLGSVCKVAFQNILNFLEAGHRLTTLDAFLTAKQYQQVVAPPLLTVTTSPPAVAAIVNPTDSNVVVIIDNKSEASQQFVITTATQTGLAFFKQKLQARAPVHECDGSEICGTCAVEVVSVARPIEQSEKEKRLLEANGFKAQGHVLTCAHSIEELKGGVFRLTS